MLEFVHEALTSNAGDVFSATSYIVPAAKWVTDGRALRAAPVAAAQMTSEINSRVDMPPSWRRVSLTSRKSVSFAAADDAIKRVLDVTIAATALILLSPLLVMLYVICRLVMGAPVFYAQPRIGRHGVPFTCYKFRTMVSNGDEVLARHLASNSAAADEWRSTQKLMKDPRVPAFGNLLRKSSLDEIPQLYNVLRGEMSCVGPRPIVDAELRRYGVHARDYAQTRPGLTGLWQISGRSRVSYAKRVALDVYYVKNRTLWLDVLIMLKTIPALLDHRNTA